MAYIFKVTARGLHEKQNRIAVLKIHLLEIVLLSSVRSDTFPKDAAL